MASHSTQSQAPCVAFVTLGCAKNEVDTDRMRALVTASGMRVTDSVEEADVAVVNTCSFLVAAVEEGIDTIFDVLASEGFSRHGGKVVVAGCMPSRYGDALAGELSEAAAFLPVEQEGSIAEVIGRLTGFEPACDPTASDGSHASHATAPLRTDSGPSAYVKISDGCDRRCSFCTIPDIRGRYASRPADEVLAEMGELAQRGVREMVLIGQDTGVWGHDLPAGPDGTHPTLADLLERAALRFPDIWVRVLYVQPEGITDRLLDVVAKYPNLASYFDIPVQHASARVLHEMNRAGDPESLLAVVRNIRRRVPGAYLRTTVMAGFPGETDEDLDTLVSFLSEARFDYTGVFEYSQEEGTPAGDRTDQVDEETKRERADRLRDVADSTGFSQAARHVGETLDMLVEEHDDDEGEWLGRTQGQAPEVDGQVHVPDRALARLAASPAPGDIIKVRITDAYCYELEGEAV